MGDAPTVGFIDIGTNSIRLLVVTFYPGTDGAEVYRDREAVRLGASLYRDGRIDRGSIEKCRLVTDRFTEVARRMGAEEVTAIATCAAREAENRAELLEALESDGLEVRVVPGEEEARLIRLGVLGPSGPRENTLLLDIGGGSTELSVSNGGEYLYLDSLPMGAVRYAYGFPYDASGPLTDEEYSSYQYSVDLHSYRAAKAVKGMGFARAVGSSGTLEALAEVCAARTGGDPSRLRLADLRKTMRKLRSLDCAGRCAVPKVQGARADIIVPGGAIAEELMSVLGIEEMEISRRGLEEGMKADYLLNHGVMNIDVRESSVLSLASRCRFDRPHAEEVARLACMAFDQLKGLGLHKMGDGERSLLRYASLLHDVGELFGCRRHHVTGYGIIAGSDMLGFGCGEIEAVALIVRFHHKRFPAEDDPMLAGLGRARARSLRRCIAMLKLADAMDRHHMGAVRSFSMSLDGGAVRLELESDRDVGMEVWRLESVAPEFEDAFGRALLPVSAPVNVREGRS